MTTSGTVGHTVLYVDDLITAAIRRCGISPGLQTAETSQIGRQCLYLFFSHLSSRGIQLWTIDRVIFGSQPNQLAYPLPFGTIDTLNGLWRTPTRATPTTATSSSGGTADFSDDLDTSTTCTQTLADGNIAYDLGSATTVVSFGYLPYADATMNLVLESSSDNATWTSRLALGSIAMTANTWVWRDMWRPGTAQYWRVRETGGGTINAAEVYLASGYTSIPMARLNRDDYANLPNQTQTAGTVTQFYLDSSYPELQVLANPVPNDAFHQMVMWRYRQIEDIGSMTNTVEAPQRWTEAIIANLAAMMSIQLDSVEGLQVDPSRITGLDAQAKQRTKEVEAQERDNSPIYFVAGIGPYTR